MPRLFTYTIPIDDGAAPNPFNGMCSLAICKPRIRSVAKPGDWIAGLGSKDAPSRDLSRKLLRRDAAVTPASAARRGGESLTRRIAT